MHSSHQSENFPRKKFWHMRTSPWLPNGVQTLWTFPFQWSSSQDIDKLPTTPHTHTHEIKAFVCVIAKLPTQCSKDEKICLLAVIWEQLCCFNQRQFVASKLILSQIERRMSISWSMRTRGGPWLPFCQACPKFTSWVWLHHWARWSNMCMCVQFPVVVC